MMIAMAIGLGGFLIGFGFFMKIVPQEGFWPGLAVMLICFGLTLIGTAASQLPIKQDAGQETFLVEPKYQLPIWLQALWWIVAVPAAFAGLSPSLDRLTLEAAAMLLLFTCVYNKAKTGMWFPGAKNAWALGCGIVGVAGASAYLLFLARATLR